MKERQSFTISQPVKKAFSLRSFHALFDRLAVEFPDMEITAWEDIIRNAFDLTPEQEMSLQTMSPIESESMQQRFISIEKHILDGGSIQGRIIKSENGTHQAVVNLYNSSKYNDSVPNMLVIVECDANCENWVWFP